MTLTKEILVQEINKLLPCLEIMSDSCLDRTGAASAGLPGLTIGEQIGGMWNSMAEMTKH